MLIQTADYGVLSKYLYFNLVNQYMNLFGNRLLVTFYEEFSEDQELFLEGLSENMGVSSAPFKTSLPAKKVKSKSNSSIYKTISYRWKEKLHIYPWEKSNDVFSANHRKFETKDVGQLEETIKGYFREDNYKLEDLLNVDLTEFGYAT